MRPPLVLAIALLIVAAGAFEHADARTLHGIPVPGRELEKTGGVHLSRMTFRQTVRYYNAFLKQRKIEHTAVPIYRYRGVTVARWVSKDPKTPWAAIHVWQRRGKTRIFIVPTPQPSNKP